VRRGGLRRTRLLKQHWIWTILPPGLGVLSNRVRSSVAVGCGADPGSGPWACGRGAGPGLGAGRPGHSRSGRCRRPRRGCACRPLTAPPGAWLSMQMHLPAEVGLAMVRRGREQAELSAALAPSAVRRPRLHRQACRHLARASVRTSPAMILRRLRLGDSEVIGRRHMFCVNGGRGIRVRREGAWCGSSNDPSVSR